MTASRVDDHKHSAGVGMWVAWVLGALAVLVQMVTNGRYGLLPAQNFDVHRNLLSRAPTHSSTIVQRFGANPQQPIRG